MENTLECISCGHICEGFNTCPKCCKALYTLSEVADMTSDIIIEQSLRKHCKVWRRFSDIVVMVKWGLIPSYME